jgi:CBS domain-containing protein
MIEPTILVVEADSAVRADLERDVQRRYGREYRLAQADSGADGLAECRSLRERNHPVAVLLAAQDLPDMSGTAFLADARTLCPAAGRVLLTAHADAEAAIAGVNEVGLDRYLVKPWGAPKQQLYPMLDELLGDWLTRSSLPYTRVKDVMERDVARLDPAADLAEAAKVVAAVRVGDLMVVDHDGEFVGVLSEGDILRSSLPDLDEILAAGGTLYDGYQLFMRKARELSAKPITPLVIREPLVMHPDDHVAKAATVLIDRQIRLLPVVEDGRLVGTVSRANICRAVVETA